MRKSLTSISLILLIVFFMLEAAHAAHPLITDDAGTVGKGSVQIEVNYQYSHDRNEGAKEDEHEIETVLTYGLIDPLDLVITLPFLFTKTVEEGSRDREAGIGDMSFEVKWRFYEAQGLALAFKPGVSFPTGAENRGLGTGRVGASAFVIATQEWETWAFHLNLGYIRNENKVDERRNLYHVSLAAEWEATEWVKLVGNVGAEANTDKDSDTPAAFVLGGLIFPVAEWLDLDVGIKGGLTRAEPDYALMAGMCFHF